MGVDRMFSEELDQLRSRIDRMNGGSVEIFEGYCHHNVQQIRAFADLSRDAADKLDAVDSAITRFARTFEDQWASARAGDGRATKAIDDARRAVHVQIDALAQALDGVGLNDEGKAMFGDGP